MRKQMLVLTAAVLGILVAMPAFAATPRYKGPVKAGAALVDPKYPILMGDPDMEDQVTMKLHLSRLGSDGAVMLNFNRKTGSFELDRISGYVWDDERGNHIYKQGCGNLLLPFPIHLDCPTCPACPTCTPPPPAPKPEPGIIRRAWDGLWNFGKWLVSPFWYGGVEIRVADPAGPYVIDSYGVHRVVVIPPHGDDKAATFRVY